MQCQDAKRVNVSAAFFLSIEFQETEVRLQNLQGIIRQLAKCASTGSFRRVLARCSTDLIQRSSRRWQLAGSTGSKQGGILC